MKLIKFTPHVEGDNIPFDSLFVVGSIVERHKFNGVYVVFNSPFKYNTKYVSEDFKETTGICHNRYMVMVRKFSDDKVRVVFNNTKRPIK